MRVSELVEQAHKLQISTGKSPMYYGIMIEVIETSLTILEDFILNIEYEKKDKTAIALRGLLIRAFKSLQSSTLLALAGLELPTLSLLRDVIEIEVLIRLFVPIGTDHIEVQSEKIESWLKSDKKSRMKHYNSTQLMQIISNGDMKREDAMRSDYRGHCEVGTHPTPQSFAWQRSDAENKLELGKDQSLVFSATHEVAFHAERLAKYIAIIGGSLDSGNEFHFVEHFKKLDGLSQKFEATRHLTGIAIGSRIGDPKAMLEHMEWMIKNKSIWSGKDD